MPPGPWRVPRKAGPARTSSGLGDREERYWNEKIKGQPRGKAEGLEMVELRPAE